MMLLRFLPTIYVLGALISFPPRTANAHSSEEGSDAGLSEAGRPKNQSPRESQDTPQSSHYDDILKADEFDPDTFYVGEVIVSGRRIANIEQAGTVTIVDSGQIEAHGDKTLDDVLRRVPGIKTITHTKGHVRVRMRGFDQDKVAILIDGIPINDVYATDVNIATIPVIHVAKIVINRGVSSALYGTDGAIGSINVITKKASRSFFSADSEYGSYNNVTHSLAHGAPIGNFYYYTGLTMQHSQGYVPSAKLNVKLRRKWFDKIVRYDLYPLEAPFAEPPYGTNTFDDVLTPGKNQYIYDRGRWNHQQSTSISLLAKGGYSFTPDLETGLSSSFYFQNAKTNTYEPYAYNSYRGTNWRPKYPYFGDEQDQVKKFALRNRSFVWPAIYRLEIAPYFRARIKKFSAKLNAYALLHGSKQEGYASNDHRYIKGDTVLLKGQDVYEPFYDRKRFLSLGFRFYPSYKFSNWHRLNMAIHFRHDTYLGHEQAIGPTRSPQIYEVMGGEPYLIEDLRAQSFSLAIEDEIKLFNRLKIAAGVSYDVQNFSHFQKRDREEMKEMYIVRDDAALMGTRDSFNPVVGLVYDPIKRRLRLRGAGSMKTRFPTLSEYAKIETSTQDVGLKPERSYNLNVGLEIFFLDKGISLRSDYFLSMIDDRIVRFSRDDPPTNIERVVAQGVETVATAQFAGLGSLGSLFVSASHTYVHARNRDYDKNATVNRGEYLPQTPEHHFSLDLGLEFARGTSLDFWLMAFVGERIYGMKSRPTQTDDPYSTDYFGTVRLHDPVYLNARVSQKFWGHYEASLIVRNLLDDYGADPFNPGRGRMAYVSLSADW